MSNLKKDILIAAGLIIGVVCFVSGEFIVSSVLFAAAALFSTIHANRRPVNMNQNQVIAESQENLSPL